MPCIMEFVNLGNSVSSSQSSSVVLTHYYSEHNYAHVGIIMFIIYLL